MRLLRPTAAGLAFALTCSFTPAYATTPGAPAFVVDGGTTVRVSGATKLATAIDLRNYSTFTPDAGSAVVITGYGAPLLLGVANFADLTLAFTSTATLSNPATVNGVLTLSNGKLTLAGHDLTANTIAGGSATSYVMTPDTLGRLVRTVGSATSVAFPVGNSAYDPVTVRTGTGTDHFRVAVLDAPPAGFSPNVALARAWAISQSNAPGTNGTLTYSLQWNAGEAGASFDRTLGNPTSAYAWRWLDGSWSVQPGVRGSDNGTYPALDVLATPATGLWTLAGLGSALAVDPSALPPSLELAPAQPNPLHGLATIRYALPARTHVTLALYSLMGQRVATLADGEQFPGTHVAALDASRLPGGMYFVRLDAGGVSQSRKCVVVN